MNLFWKIFLSFGATIVLTLVGAVVFSSRLAERAFEHGNLQGEELVARADNALDEGGREALIEWLENNDRPESMLVLFMLDENGNELLGRSVDETFRNGILKTEEDIRRCTEEPPPAFWRQQRRGPGGNRNDQTPPERDEPTSVEMENYCTFYFVRSRYDSFRILSRPDPETFAFDRYYFQIIAQRQLFGIFNWPSAQISLVIIAAIAAALMALAMARYISRPIVRLQKASRALAAGHLDTRVGGAATGRNDELGILAHDFDSMAEHLQGLITAKETLLRDISHELRSPLARIRVALALAERHTDEKARQDFERIEQETERLDALVGQVMMLTRLRSEREVGRDPVKLEDCVDEIVENARFEFPNVEVDFRRQSVPTVYGEEPELRSAIENVVRNALSFSGDGGKVSVRLATAPGGVSVTVADSGPGVPEGELENIFEPFYRTDQSRNHERRGEGIGLAITARVMERHGGKVVARNRPTGGLEIEFTIPLNTPPLHH